jgi:linoleoyl-CoA desaturase
MKVAKFDKTHSQEFIMDLRQAVDAYFKRNNKSRYANANMVFKTIFMLALYYVPYALMISGSTTGAWGFWSMWVLMGFGMAGIGLSVMHDANHGAYSSNKLVNTFFGLTLNALAGSAKNWRVQHNRLHHTYTNVHDMDPDVSPAPMLRFSPDAPLKKIHKLQHIYAWFFYSLMTVSWSTAKEFIQLNGFKRDGVIQKSEYWPMMLEMVAWKIVYYCYMLVLPYILLDVSLGALIVGYLTLHLIAGFILSIIFQTAHVMPDCDSPKVNKEGTIENNWAIHQLQTTSNYAPNSKFFSWFVGGLNFQVEHHLFPTICHVHYKSLSKIVQEKAKKYNLPYYSQHSFLDALRQHKDMLKKLGRV